MPATSAIPGNAMAPRENRGILSQSARRLISGQEDLELSGADFRSLGYPPPRLHVDASQSWAILHTPQRRWLRERLKRA